MFEIAKTPTGYASPTTLASFSLADNQATPAALIADANGDLFGTTEDGGANGDRRVFEIAKTPTGYASAATTLVSFNFTNGAYPWGAGLPTPRAISSALRRRRQAGAGGHGVRDRQNRDRLREHADHLGHL